MQLLITFHPGSAIDSVLVPVFKDDAFSQSVFLHIYLLCCKLEAFFRELKGFIREPAAFFKEVKGFFQSCGRPHADAWNSLLELSFSFASESLFMTSGVAFVT